MSRKTAPLVDRNLYVLNVLECLLAHTMASIDSRKRKLAEDGTRIFVKSHKRHQSDHTLISSVDYQAQLNNGKTGEVVNIASAIKVPPVKKVAKQQQASGRFPGSSANIASAVRPAKAGPSKKIGQKQKVFRSGDHSSDEGDISIADATEIAPDTASKVALITTPISPSEEDSGEGDGPEEDDEDDEEDDEEEDRDEKAEPNNGDEETRARRLKKKARLEKNLPASDSESDTNSESSMDSASEAVLDSDDESHSDQKRKETIKADDPNAFASSMSAILGSNLTRTQRADPILARSADAKEAEEALLDRKLEKKARAEMKREKVDKGGWEPDMMFGNIHGEGGGELVGPTDEAGPRSAYQQREKELRKMAQKGVVKMFNAFAHVREKAVEAQGMVGSRAKKEEKATEMSKEGWLEYVGLGGKGKIEEMGKGKVVGGDSA